MSALPKRHDHVTTWHIPSSNATAAQKLGNRKGRAQEREPITGSGGIAHSGVQGQNLGSADDIL